ncbi:MAG: hypothetical protein CM1200mP20_06410 [Pseudomonadota bacterium]|nr:MAG: hypothetical protein CM1200mP20_06410 [Pseudomonadota bacterium]
MARMKNLQPRMKTLKERFGDDKQKFQQAMMEMYKKEKINPFGSCLPIVIQIPVFIRSTGVLLESVELRPGSVCHCGSKTFLRRTPTMSCRC